jgi:GxxExxY protein
LFVNLYLRMNIEVLSNSIIGAAINVHKELGQGLLESIYEDSLCHELKILGIEYEKQKHLPFIYKGVKMKSYFRIDLLIENEIIVEIKSTEHLIEAHSAQLLSYLKISNKRLGLLLNFNVPLLKNGIKRISNDYYKP